MQFIDEAEIHVKAGDGGPGAIAFRREKFVPRGGPSGGDGGDGADIVLETDERLTTLLDFRFKREYRAKNGEPGRGRDQNGHAAPTLLLKVPPGTVIKDVDTGEIIADLSQNGTRYVLAKGGRGGLGNMNFATPTLQAPRFAQPGTEGEEKRVRLELRLLADVGLVGFPNAGKSTLVSRLSRAKPKIADYPFTTLQPHLGVVQYKDGRSFVLTDLPGLIEGAHEGAGLGHRFLKHMQRCRAMVHLIDASQDRDLLADYEAINRELRLFDRTLGEKPQIVVANKIDVPEGRERAEALRKKLKRRKIDVMLMSGATGEGLPAVVDAMVAALDRAGAPLPFDRDTRHAADDEAGAAPEVAAPLEPLEDERELQAQEKAERAKPPTGRLKDGTLRVKVAGKAPAVVGKPRSAAAKAQLETAARREQKQVRELDKKKAKKAQKKAAPREGKA